jgi:hypothetical protein
MVGGQVLWNPSNGVAELFVRTAEAVALTVGLPCGIGAMQADEYELDMRVFAAFVDSLVGRYSASSHLILRSLLEGFTATALVLARRAGRSVPALDAIPSLDQKDVSVGPAGIGRLGEARHLSALADEHARAMPY